MFDEMFDDMFEIFNKEINKEINKELVNVSKEDPNDSWSTGQEQRFWKDEPEAGSLWKN